MVGIRSPIQPPVRKARRSRDLPQALPRERKGDRGVAMLVTLLALLMVTLSVLVTTSVVDLRTNLFRGEERRVMATALADAALAETLAHLDEEPSFRGVTERALGIGRISSSVVYGNKNTRKVTASGWVGEFAVQIDAVVTVEFSRARIVRWDYRQGPKH